MNMIRAYKNEELPLFQETVLGELVLMNPRSKTSPSDDVTTMDTINKNEFLVQKEDNKNTRKMYHLLVQEPFVSPQASSTNGWTDEIEVPPCIYHKKGGFGIRNEAENAESVQQGVTRLDESRFNYRGMTDRDENEPNTTSSFIEQEIPQPDSSIDMISDAPRANDILCAKGKRSFDHIGNRKFRSCIASHYQAYLSARSRSEKSSLIRSIVTHLVQEKGCRFLKRKSKNDHWYDIGYKGAECKVAHSFRDARTDRNKSIYKLHQSVRQVSQPMVPLTPTSPREINNMEVYQEQSSPADQLSNVSYAVRGYDYYPQVSPPVGSCCCSRALDDFNEMSLSDLEESLHNGIIRSNDI